MCAQAQRGNKCFMWDRRTLGTRLSKARDWISDVSTFGPNDVEVLGTANPKWRGDHYEGS